MALNREQKRMLQRQGELGPDGEPIRARRGTQQRAKERTGPVEFAREVRSELRKVAWPTRSETINYSIITIVTLIFGLYAEISDFLSSLVTSSIKIR